MVRKSLILNFIFLICGCTATPFLRTNEIETRQGRVSIINGIGLDRKKDAISLTGKPHKDPNNSDIIRQEYSLQVDF